MNPVIPCILTLNGGSSSIKFAVYKLHESLDKIFSGELQGISSSSPKLDYTSSLNSQKQTVPVKIESGHTAADFLIDWLEKQEIYRQVTAIGHRIVQGMEHVQPEKISPALLEDLKRISVYDPEHLPAEIKLIEVFTSYSPDLPQVACYDTGFHAAMPDLAKLLPVPRKYQVKGLRRYGFHGLSYAYLMQELRRLAGAEAAGGRVILAHLGSGASMAAVSKGMPVDTSMGFTPSSGLVMSTRTGDLDPGLAWYFMDIEKMDAAGFSRLINHESGLLGVSETSADMRELRRLLPDDYRAAQAIALFCYQAKKYLGAFSATLGGLDTLIFSGGIGEHDALVRAEICQGLEFLGIDLDEEKNNQHAAVISSGRASVTVRVMQTNEEIMIAEAVCTVLNYPLTIPDGDPEFHPRKGNTA